MWIKVGDVVMLTGRRLYIEESVIHIAVNLHRPRSVLCCTVQHLQHRLEACAVPSVSLGAGQTQPGDGNGGGHQQLPLSTGNCIFILLGLINSI